MLLAALIPRPGAEIALSRVPWQRSSSENLEASQASANRNGGGKGESSTADSQDNTPQEGGDASIADGQSTDADDGSSAKRDGEKSGATGDELSDRAGKDPMGQGSEEAQDAAQEHEQSDSSGSQPPAEATEQADAGKSPSTPHSEQVQEALQKLSQVGSKIGDLFKMLFYGALVLLVCFVAWTYRHQILQSLADILNQLRALFGGKASLASKDEIDAASIKAPPPSFHDFRDPFSTGEHNRKSPEELVRYTFAAFEAWAHDRGRARTPDCTPHELVRQSLDPESPMYENAQRLARLYGEMAYASRSIPRESAAELATLWQMMHRTHSFDLAIAGE
jgi:hypothetical protein